MSVSIMVMGIRWSADIAFVLCLICYVSGEMRFVCPRPQLPNSAITEGPCGAGTAEPFEDNFVEVTPGPFTIRLEETIAHKGAPIRIALMHWNKNIGSCVLLDHVPHNDAARPISTNNCIPGSYPLGQCYMAQYYLTVQIPDIECERCVLQMINVATDMHADGEKPCYQRDDGYNNCTTFYSCANIRVRPTPNGVGKGVNSCHFSRLRLNNKWPYTPMLFFEVKLGTPFLSENYLRLYERPDWTLEFETNLNSRNVTVGSGSVGIFDGSRPVAFLQGTLGRVRALGAEKRENLHNGTYHMRITVRFRNGTYKNFRFPIYPPVARFQEGYYRDHGINYATGGVLKGDKFAGARATYSEINYPAGQCQAGGKESFGAVLTLHKSFLPRGIFTYTISRDLIYAQAASSYPMVRIVFGTKWNKTDGKPGRENKLFNNGAVSGYMFEGSQFMTTTLMKTGGRPPNTVSVVVRPEQQLDVLIGDFIRGIKAEIKDGDDMIGLAFIAFNQELPSFNMYVMISNNTGFLSDDFELSLDGPTESFPISKVKAPVELDGGTYFFNVTVPIIDMEIPQYMWAGLFAVTVKSIPTSMEYSGQLERLSSTVCEGSNNVACRARVLLTTGGYVDRGAAEIEPNGMAMISVGSQQTVMDISISIQDIRDGDSVDSVKILKDGTNYLEIPGFTFQPALPIKTRVFGKSRVGINAEIVRNIAQNKLSLSVTVTRTKTQTFRIFGRIYPASVFPPGFTISPAKENPSAPNPGNNPPQSEWEMATTRPPDFKNPFNSRIQSNGNAPALGLISMMTLVMLVLMCIQ